EAFRAEAIYSAQDVIACRPAHPLAGRRSLALEDLVGYTWLVPYSRPSDRDVIVETFVAADLEPPDRFIGSDAYRIGMNLLTANDFLLMTSPALVTSRLARETGGVRILPIEQPTVRRHASLVTPTERPMTPAATALLAAVRDAAARFGKDALTR
ncbi:MAG: LysR substrate-binding domain-containing protein, partial [Gammaproteobacteria bacterium]